MENKLISMTDFIIQQKEKLRDKLLSEPYDRNDLPKSYDLICNYAEFLRQRLTLGMFVPVDEKENVLEHPKMEKYGYFCATYPEERSEWMYPEGEEKYYKALDQWNKANENVLFEGFEILWESALTGVVIRMSDLKRIYVHENTTIERFTHLSLGLTPSALKQIGLNPENKIQ